MIESVFQTLALQHNQSVQPNSLPPSQECDLSQLNVPNAISPKLASMFGSVLVASTVGKGRKRKRRRRRNNNNRDATLAAANDAGYEM